MSPALIKVNASPVPDPACSPALPWAADCFGGVPVLLEPEACLSSVVRICLDNTMLDGCGDPP